MLSATNITKHFGRRQVLKGVDLALERGKITAILGPNGAGKTTLIKILSTLNRADSGSISIDGIDTMKEPQRVRRKLGFLAHEPLLYMELTPLENLKLFGELYRVNHHETDLRKRLSDVGLLPFAHSEIRFFSKGMLQRLAIAKALIHDPELVFLDEPFAGLDATARTFVLNFLKGSKDKNKAVLLVSHDVELAYSVADEFALLFGGKIVDVLTKDRYSLREVLELYERRLEGN
ncbi:MAG: ABC transporter ATP-binding protein [Actinomycetota bacterium]